MLKITRYATWIAKAVPITTKPFFLVLA